MSFPLFKFEKKIYDLFNKILNFFLQIFLIFLPFKLLNGVFFFSSLTNINNCLLNWMILWLLFLNLKKLFIFILIYNFYLSPEPNFLGLTHLKSHLRNTRCILLEICLENMISIYRAKFMSSLTHMLDYIDSYVFLNDQSNTPYLMVVLSIRFSH